MLDRAAGTSPQVYARIGGILYLVIIVAGFLGEMFVRSTLVVPGDAGATAARIMAAPWLWRVGIAGDLVMHVCDVPLMLVFYLLLSPVSRPLAGLAILFNVVQTAVLVANKLNLLNALLLLGSAEYLQAFTPQQLHALAYVPIRSHAGGFGIGLIFFAFTCLVLGHLIRRSGYLPAILGVLMQVAGACYLTNSFALLLAPKSAAMMFPWILLPCLVAELSLALWLLVKGVDQAKWDERVRAGATSLGDPHA
jgi:hypothetical protein